MNSNIAWKLVVTVAIIGWSILNVVPWKDTPFETYVREAAKADTAGFNEVVDRALALTQEDSKTYPTLFVALKRLGENEGLDLAPYFPQIDVSDIASRVRRNEVILTELQRQANSRVRLGLDLKGGVAVTFKLDESSLAENEVERTEQIAKAKSILLDRIDGLGVAEPIVREKGANRIEVQMAGISTKDNPDILAQIGAPALLEFSLVDRFTNPLTNPEPPLGYTRMVMEYENPQTGEVEEIPEYVKIVPVMGGESISEAVAMANPFGGYRIALSFTDEGSKKFAAVTKQIAEENSRTGTVGRLAIILDGKLYSAPSVREEIIGGAEITGSFSQREAVELANVLNNPLEVGLVAEEVYEVGPSLATEAREASLYAAAMASVFVLIFMFVVYKFGGVIASMALVLNVLFVVATLASFGGTLSLPGVAALVLTIGMAVDANILVFERVREEMKAGKSLSTALQIGHEKALSAIIDSNLTTLMASGILMWLGTGPIKGFGVTLAIGIIANMFTVLVVSRFMLEFSVEKGLLKNIFGIKTFQVQDVPFLSYFKKSSYIAAACLLIGVASTAISHKQIFGIDFVGGDEVALTFKTPISTADVSKVAESIGIGEVTSSFQSTLGQDTERLVVTTPAGQGGNLVEALQSAYPDAGLELLAETQVGASVGKEVRWNALLSIAVALLGMLLYVAIRFEFGYGFGAVVSLLFAVIMAVGLYIFFGQMVGVGSGQFTAPMVAAVLMVLGYAINDTIVVFDRIREELLMNPSTPLNKIVNSAICLTLSRTLLTSTTTIFASIILILFGASIIVDFSLMFLMGILTGTFSSIFIASPIFYWYHKGDRRKVEEKHILPTYDWHSGEPTAAKSVPAVTTK